MYITMEISRVFMREQIIENVFKEELYSRLCILMASLGKDFQLEVSEPEYPEVGRRRIRFTIYVDLNDEEYFMIRRKIFTIISDIIDRLRCETIYSNGAFSYTYVGMDETLRNLMKMTHIEILPRRFYHEARRIP